MFRCDICTKTSLPREQEYRHPIIRNVTKHGKKLTGYDCTGNPMFERWETISTEIVKELRICKRCHDIMNSPTDNHTVLQVSQLMSLFRKEHKALHDNRSAPPYRLGEQKTKGKNKPVLARVELGNGQMVSVPVNESDLSLLEESIKKPRTKKQRKLATKNNGSVNKPVKPGIDVTSRPKTR